MNGQTRFVWEQLFLNHQIKSVLNIGFRHDSDKTIMNGCIQRGISWTVLEAFQSNCDEMAKAGISVVCMDVKNIENYYKNFDCILWLHGPEHVTWNDFLSIRSIIENKANKLVIYQAPIGEYPQDSIYGNPYERHLTSLTSSMFSQLGYHTKDHNDNGESTFSAYIIK
jgi:hypothetical protein